VSILSVSALTLLLTQLVGLQEGRLACEGEQIRNGTSAQFRLFSASNGRWAKN